MLSRLAVLILLSILWTACLSSDDGEPTATPVSTATGTAAPSSTTAPTETAVPDIALVGTSWQLIELVGEPVDPSFGVILEFGDDRLSGYSGCNEFGASFTASDSGDFVISDFFTTEVRCPEPPHLMNFEVRYYDALRSSVRFFLNRPRLALHGANDDTLLLFEPLDDATRIRATSTPAPAGRTPTPLTTQDVVAVSDLVGTSWLLVEIEGEAVDDRFQGTAIFDEEVVSGTHGGCNRYSARYTATNDGSFNVGEVVSSSEDCLGPPGLHEFELQYQAALADSYRYVISGGELSLLDDRSMPTLRFVPFDDVGSALANTSWRLIELLGEPVDPSLGVTLEFRQQNVVGWSGCNAFDAAFFALDSGALSIETMASDAAGCREPLASMNFEARYYDTLTNSIRYFLDPPRLALHGWNGDTLLLFEPLEE